MKFYTCTNFPKSEARKVVGKTMTKQNHKDECDVNSILAKFKKTGALTHLNERQAQYGEHTGLDFKEAMDIITSSQELFDDLPSELRSAFQNDPASFLDYVNDEANAEDVNAGFPAILNTDQPTAESLSSEPAPAGEPAAPGAASAPVEGAPAQ